MKINKKKCHARHAPESNLHQVEVFPYFKEEEEEEEEEARVDCQNCPVSWACVYYTNIFVN